MPGRHRGRGRGPGQERRGRGRAHRRHRLRRHWRRRARARTRRHPRGHGRRQPGRDAGHPQPRQRPRPPGGLRQRHGRNRPPPGNDPHRHAHPARRDARRGARAGGRRGPARARDPLPAGGQGQPGMGQEPPSAGREFCSMSLAPRPGSLLLATLMGALGPAQAQTPPAATAPATAPAYVDRVTEGLQPETLDEDAGYDYDRAGWPRFLKLETRLGTQPFDESQRTRLGYNLYGLLETPNHGTLSLDGSFTPSDRQGTLTLRQRGMPLTGGWLANHELGIISTPAPAITRLPSRVFVPTSILQGAGGEWENPGRGLPLPGPPR